MLVRPYIEGVFRPRRAFNLESEPIIINLVRVARRLQQTRQSRRHLKFETQEFHKNNSVLILD